MSGLDLFGDVSTADTGERSELDLYETARWQVLSLLHFEPSIAGSVVLEPTSGRGAIARVLREFDCTVVTNDLDPRHSADSHRDATAPDFWRHAPPAEYVIGNPPFNVAFAIVTGAVGHATRGVAMLLRKTWTEPTAERGAWLASHPPSRQICLPRHNFRGSRPSKRAGKAPVSAGTDSVPADWLVWHKGWPNRLAPIVIDHLAKTRR